jgi:plastocyanin
VPAPRSRRPARVLIVLLPALLITACGGGNGNQADPPGPAPKGDVVIKGQDYKFVPATLTLPAGREITIVFENRDRNTGHNIHFTSLPDNPKANIELGPVYQTLKVTFPAPGSYTFQCDPHAGQGMTGVVNAT